MQWRRETQRLAPTFEVSVTLPSVGFSLIADRKDLLRLSIKRADFWCKAIKNEEQGIKLSVREIQIDNQRLCARPPRPVSPTCRARARRRPWMAADLDGD